MSDRESGSIEGVERAHEDHQIWSAGRDVSAQAMNRERQALVCPKGSARAGYVGQSNQHVKFTPAGVRSDRSLKVPATESF